MTFRGTTIIAVQKNGCLAFAGDGQVTFGDQIIKSKAKKIRHFANFNILGGFAGHTADAFTLFERFESKLEAASGNLTKAAVELAKEWRLDKVLRRLEAMLLVGNHEKILMLSGQGDAMEPDSPVMAIGSGAAIAMAAAKALLRNTEMSASEVAIESMKIAAEQCIYTNAEIILETIE